MGHARRRDDHPSSLILTVVSDIWQFIIKGFVIIGAMALDRCRVAGARV